MKNRKTFAFIIAASLVAGTTATYAAPYQSDAQSSQIDQGKSGDQIQKDSSAQTPSTGELNEPAGASNENFNKESFIKDTAEANMAEINIAKLATQKSQNPQIKEYAQKLVTDHSKVGDELKSLAQKDGITLATELESQKQKTMDHLSSLSTTEFDNAFAMQMVKDHKKAIAMFKKAAAHTEDSDVREFANNCLPTLQEHLRTAQQWAPDTAAGAEVDEAAGAQKKTYDANELDKLDRDKHLQDQSPTPDSIPK